MSNSANQPHQNKQSQRRLRQLATQGKAAIPPSPSSNAIIPQGQSTTPGTGQRTPFEQVLDMLDDRSRLQLLEAVRIYKLDTKDPFFVLMLTQVTITTALLEAPQKIRQVVEETLQQASIMLDRQGESAVKTLAKKIEWEIAKTVQRIMSMQEMARVSHWSIGVASVASVTLVSFGAAGGWAVSQLQRSPIVSGKVDITEKQADLLRWMKKPEAQLAKKIVDWNTDQITVCQKNQAALFKQNQIIVPSYGAVQSGACILWVVPPDQRRFNPNWKPKKRR